MHSCGVGCPMCEMSVSSAADSMWPISEFPMLVFRHDDVEAPGRGFDRFWDPHEHVCSLLRSWRASFVP